MALSAHLTRSVLRAIDSVAARIGRGVESDRRAAHHIIGERGEEAAYFYLRHRGYTVIARNYRSPRTRGELDIVAWHRPSDHKAEDKEQTLCFIEVKTRSTRDAVFSAESAVDFEKRRDLRRIARDYLRHIPGATPRPGKKVLLPPTRFDIVSVYMVEGAEPEIELIADAFGW